MVIRFYFIQIKHTHSHTHTQCKKQCLPRKEGRKEGRKGIKGLVNARYQIGENSNDRIRIRMNDDNYALHIIIMRRVVLLSGNRRPGPRDDGMDVRS